MSNEEESFEQQFRQVLGHLETSAANSQKLVDRLERALGENMTKEFEAAAYKVLSDRVRGAVSFEVHEGLADLNATIVQAEKTTAACIKKIEAATVAAGPAMGKKWLIGGLLLAAVTVAGSGWAGWHFTAAAIAQASGARR